MTSTAHIWDAWADESGSIGKAYGYQLGVKHHYPEGDFDQVDRVLYDLKHNPASRRILTNLYNFQDLHEMRPLPLRLLHDLQRLRQYPQRHSEPAQSQDMLTANNWNVVQYAVLVHMLAQVSGLEAGELVHVIADAHIYDRHVPIVEELHRPDPLRRRPASPWTPPSRDFYAFTRDSFQLEGYSPRPV